MEIRLHHNPKLVQTSTYVDHSWLSLPFCLGVHCRQQLTTKSCVSQQHHTCLTDDHSPQAIQLSVSKKIGQSGASPEAAIYHHPFPSGPAGRQICSQRSRRRHCAAAAAARAALPAACRGRPAGGSLHHDCKLHCLSLSPVRSTGCDCSRCLNAAGLTGGM